MERRRKSYGCSKASDHRPWFGVVPLAFGLLITYDIVKIDWMSFMEIQPSYSPQEDPLPLPARSVPVQGAAYIPALGAPPNPVQADDARWRAARLSLRSTASSATGPREEATARLPPSSTPPNRPICWRAAL